MSAGHRRGCKATAAPCFNLRWHATPCPAARVSGLAVWGTGAGPIRGVLDLSKNTPG